MVSVPAATEDELREEAQILLLNVDEALGANGGAAERERAQPGTVEDTLSQRERRFAKLRGAILRVARSPAWRAHDLARELLVTLEDLRDAIDADEQGSDPHWRQREALMRMRVVVQAMLRRLDHLAIDRPEVAARFVADALDDVELGDVARLLDVSVKSLGNWREGRVEQIKKGPHRIALVGQLIYELLPSMTPRGALLWFDAPREQLGNRTPRELLDADVAEASDRLLPLARGARGQLEGDGAPAATSPAVASQRHGPRFDATSVANTVAAARAGHAKAASKSPGRARSGNGSSAKKRPS